MKKAVSVILTLSLFLLTACSLEPPNGQSRQTRATKGIHHRLVRLNA